MTTFDRRAFIGTSALAGMVPLLGSAPAQAQSGAATQASAGAGTPPLLAPRPPMGWNSWNSFATTITERQAREVAAVMAQRLLPAGYDVFTVDIQWYEPDATGYDYRPGANLAMDGNGRLQPAPNRFPSAARGAGFKSLADYVHGLGLKFGVHLMRGIPRLAYERDLPVLGTNYTARQVTNPLSVSTWNSDMYGVDMTHPGGQAYYNSVFAQMAEWGVDFVKVDDISRPYEDNWAEVEGIRAAMDATGRPMILSLSPGEANLAWGAHAQNHAQMWRISDDFWDEWQLLLDQFGRLEKWNGFRRPGAWPDADMLPLGRLRMGEGDTKFTRDEQQTLMTLWSIARSPLIMGGDIRSMDDATHRLLTNAEMIAVNQHSVNNQPIWRDDRQTVWRAQSPAGDRIYAALFNLSDRPLPIDQPLKALNAPEEARVRDIWTGQEATVRNNLSIELRPHGCAFYSIAAQA
ncbi:glycoside hydrolase family 27 protein [Croceibacterium ferulae]|uniref:glycoside hydrolase family 27 protein n=1 Tax=Croceibacterium ferulae TaxID=1854641 RepID=UPI000EB06FBD|nr:glycoside hydrolase family 27 protein [Croceibacterium ferulae]